MWTASPAVPGHACHRKSNSDEALVLTVTIHVIESDPNSADAIALLTSLSEAGVRFYVSLNGCGNKDLTPKQAIEYKESPVHFAARHFDVSPATYRQWLAFLRESFRCTAITQSGRRCELQVTGGGMPKPNEFRFGIDDRCPNHQDTD